jgi:hypothetical protein
MPGSTALDTLPACSGIPPLRRSPSGRRFGGWQERNEAAAQSTAAVLFLAAFPALDFFFAGAAPFWAFFCCFSIARSTACSTTASVTPLRTAPLTAFSIFLTAFSSAFFFAIVRLLGRCNATVIQYGAGVHLLVVTALIPSGTRRARAQARLPIFGGIAAACQTGPIRRGLLARRLLLRGAGNNFR